MQSFRSLLAITLLGTFALVAFASPVMAQEAEGKLYTRSNIWFERNPISMVNYKTGMIIPAGTEVKDVQLTERGFFRKVKEIMFTTVEGGMDYVIRYDERYAPGMSIGEVRDRFISNKTLEELTEGMTDKEKECVKDGILKEGISKEAVLVAWGYPPSHETPSLDMSMWRYWLNRFRQKPIYFDDNGKTTRGRVVQEDEL